MALINCPECGKQISDKSDICIGCGIPRNQKNITLGGRIERNIDSANKQNTNDRKTANSFLVILSILGIGFLIWLLFINPATYIKFNSTSASAEGNITYQNVKDIYSEGFLIGLTIICIIISLAVNVLRAIKKQLIVNSELQEKIYELMKYS